MTDSIVAEIVKRSMNGQIGVDEAIRKGLVFEVNGRLICPNCGETLDLTRVLDHKKMRRCSPRDLR